MNENTNETSKEFENNENSSQQENQCETADTRFEEIIESIKDDEQFQAEGVQETSSEETVDTEETQIEKLTEENAKLQDELARNRADYYNLQQEYTNYVRRAKADIPGYKNAGIEAVKKHGDLEEGPFVAIANKLETTLKTSFEVERFANIGDEFDPNMHEALLVTPNPTATKEEIGDIIQSGWRIGERIIRAAKVVVFAPAE